MTTSDSGPAELLRQLTDYLAGPARQRLPWQQHNPPTGAPYWTAHDRYGRTWSLHLPEPGRVATLPYTLRTALAALAAAERRPMTDIAADITARHGTPGPRPPRSSGAARLTNTWNAAAPHPRAPQVVFHPAPPGNLDTAIGEVFAAGFRHGWQHRAYELLLGEATTTLEQLRRSGRQPPTARPDRPITALYDEVTLASAEHYLAGHGWNLLSATAAVRRWQYGDPGTHFVEPPTGRDQRTRMLTTAVATIAAVEGRSPRHVLADLGEPLLRHPHLVRIHDLLLNPPTAATARISAALDNQTVTTTPGHEQPLGEFAHQQVQLLGATDAVWHAATRAGATAAAERLTRVLTAPPAATSDPHPHPFTSNPADPPEHPAAAIWAAGSHQQPAAHARWFTRTWWPYHLTATTRAVGAHLASELHLDLDPIDIPPARGGPDSDLLRRTEVTAHPSGDDARRFIAAYRHVDAAARQAAVPLAIAAATSYLPGGPDNATESALTALARMASDPRQSCHPPDDHVLAAALAQAGPQPKPVAADRPPPDAAFPPPWRALLSTSPVRSTATPTDPTLVNPTSPNVQHQLRRQQVIEAAAGAITRTAGGTRIR